MSTIRGDGWTATERRDAWSVRDDQTGTHLGVVRRSHSGWQSVLPSGAAHRSGSLPVSLVYGLVHDRLPISRATALMSAGIPEYAAVTLWRLPLRQARREYEAMVRRERVERQREAIGRDVPRTTTRPRHRSAMVHVVPARREPDPDAPTVPHPRYEPDPPRRTTSRGGGGYSMPVDDGWAVVREWWGMAAVSCGRRVPAMPGAA